MPVDEAEAEVAVDVGDARRDVVHDEPQLGLGRAQRLLRLLQAVDVVHQHERAVHLARGGGVRHDADRHPAAHAVRARNEPVERGRLALERARDHRLRALVDPVADDVAQAELRDLLRRQAEVLEERPVDVVAVLVVVDVRDRCRHAVHDRAELRFARGEGVLRFLEVADVVADDVLALGRPVVIEVGNAAGAEPPLAAHRVDHRALVGDRLAEQAALAVRGERERILRAEDLLGALADDFLAHEPVEPQERLVDEHVAAIAVEIDDRLRNVVGEQAQLLLARGERLLGLLEIVDVVFGAVEPAHLAGRVEVGRDPAVHPAPLAQRVVADALVLDVVALLRALEDRPQERRDVAGEHVLRRLAVDLVLRLAHPVREGLVDERVLERAVEVRDRARDVVGEEAQLDFLRLQRVADADVVLDVGHHGERAADPAADFAVGEQRHAHPAQLAARLPVAPLVGDGRAGECPLDVTLHLGRRLAGENVAQHAPEKIVRRDADPVAEGLVGEAHL